MLHTLKTHWFSNVKNDVLSGLVVALALIPEAIAFSIIAGLDPKVGLYALLLHRRGDRLRRRSAGDDLGGHGRHGAADGDSGQGTRPAVPAGRHPVTGVLQIAAGYLRLGALMRFVSRSVVTGFVNALAILIFLAQLPELTHVGWEVYAMTAAGWASSICSPCCRWWAGCCRRRWSASWC